MSSGKPEHLISLSVANVKCLKAVRIKLDGESNTVVISGANGAGKSSVLDSIEMLLCGKKSIPDEPIRRGSDKAVIIGETESYIITRTFTAKDSYIQIKTRDGFKFTEQELLNRMLEKSGFDGLAFANMTPDEQGKKLLSMFPTEIDLGENAMMAKSAFSQRTDVNRDCKGLESRISAIPEPPEGTPTVEVSASALFQNRNSLQGEINQRDLLTRSIESTENDIKAADLEMVELTARYERVMAEKKSARSQFVVRLEAQKKASSELRDKIVIQSEFDALNITITGADAKNKLIRSSNERAALKVELKKKQAESEKFTNQIKSLEEKRAKALSEAKFPVPGLSINAEGLVTLNGILLKQSSMAQKLIVGISIAAAANNKLRICLIRDASLLDVSSMKLVEQIAREKNIQVWLERVDDSSPAAIQIIDGSTVGTTAEDIQKPEIEAPAPEKSEELQLFGGQEAAKKPGSKKKPHPVKDNTDPFSA